MPDDLPHDTTDDTTDAPSDRSLSWWPLVGAAVIVGLVVVLLLVAGSGGGDRIGTKTDSDGALTCPPTYKVHDFDHWVPTDASGVNGKKKLVPDAKPSHVTICRYAYATPSRGKTVHAKLSGHRTLTNGLRALTGDLSKLHKSNSDGGGILVVGETQSVYLIGLTFASGVVWVSVPDGNSASNGQFTTSSALHGKVAKAFESRAWK